MGYEKEQMIIREENARRRAKEDGHVCGHCTEPLLTAKEIARGSCNPCEDNLTKDD